MDIEKILKQVQATIGLYQSQVINFGIIHFAGVKEDGTFIQPTTNAYAMEDAKYVVVFIGYTYRVVTNTDNSHLVMFAGEDGILGDKLLIDGWKMTFNAPRFDSYCTYNRTVTISKEGLRLELSVKAHELTARFEDVWQFFTEAQKCTTQHELELLGKLFKQNKAIDDATIEVGRQKAENERLKELVVSHQKLLSFIEQHLP
jgi:hypothetical protein